MYKIIGADQKEYGPISADQLRAWINEGRVNAQTRARAEGTDTWQPLSALPEFADCFGAPASGPSPGPLSSPPSVPHGSGSAAQTVKAPAIALIVVASIGAAYYALSGIFTLAGGQALFHQELPPNVPPQMKAFIEGMQGPVAGFLNLVIAALNGFVIFGAIKMLKMRSFGLAMAACIVAMLPCQCCCLLGLPFGIWGLVMLNKPEVKSQFE